MNPLVLFFDFVEVGELLKVNAQVNLRNGCDEEADKGIAVAGLANEKAVHAHFIDWDFFGGLCNHLATLGNRGLRFIDVCSFGECLDADFWSDTFELERYVGRVANERNDACACAPEVPIDIPVGMQREFGGVCGDKCAGRFANGVFVGARNGCSVGIRFDVNIGSVFFGLYNVFTLCIQQLIF